MENKKIKAKNVSIVVDVSNDDPYYSIKYDDLSDGKTHIGYGSYHLGFVTDWLNQYFEIVGSEEFENRTEENKEVKEQLIDLLKSIVENQTIMMKSLNILIEKITI